MDDCEEAYGYDHIPGRICYSVAPWPCSICFPFAGPFPKSNSNWWWTGRDLNPRPPLAGPGGFLIMPRLSHLVSGPCRIYIVRPSNFITICLQGIALYRREYVEKWAWLGAGRCNIVPFRTCRARPYQICSGIFSIGSYSVSSSSFSGSFIKVLMR